MRALHFLKGVQRLHGASGGGGEGRYKRPKPPLCKVRRGRTALLPEPSQLRGNCKPDIVA